MFPENGISSLKEFGGDFTLKNASAAGFSGLRGTPCGFLAMT